MNRAAIFDMDGLLVDSEPLWWRAGVEALASVGIHLDDSQLNETIGLRTDTAVAHWFSRFPWSGKSQRQIEDEVQLRVLQLIRATARPLPGVRELLDYLASQRMPLGLCSSSPYPVIDAVLGKLELTDVFHIVYSAEDEPFGKPHPGAYLTCASRIGVPAARCVAFEDSLPGARSAKAAQMKVIAVPNPASAVDTSFEFCDARLGSLLEFTPELLAELLPA
jgi:HAD superfamily hydrolase (TIGR01509 family)